MKVIFEDTVYDKPTVTREFSNKNQLNAFLSEFGHFKYAFKATIMNDSGVEVLVLNLSDRGFWMV